MNIKNRDILKVQISESDIVELGSWHILLQNLFPEASMEKKNSPWWGWEESLIIFPARDIQHLGAMSWIEGIEVPVIFSAVLTSLLTFQGLARLLLPEVDNDLFGFVHVQDQVGSSCYTSQPAARPLWQNRCSIFRTLAFKANNGTAPIYLPTLVRPRPPSVSTMLHYISWTTGNAITESKQRWLSKVTTPLCSGASVVEWTPTNVRTADSIWIFCKRLQTHLFRLHLDLA